ncbi:MAG: tetratricopeptide repeat protein [Candidatus Eisenbacteria bacterium]|uniref:Tetratricopeptide repeat protein n=1 Tax=Eiseniibacteriota bacterium TaxID=2212470 RepID=A0A956SDH3_UNCEI|nr:tetratricopeptide repeat protein [Candidatus Eisenbacteria bacterium]MCB9462756.1 tetratricopeptide repeat protein [Candidatus Eisenbacteria bacterium]
MELRHHAGWGPLQLGWLIVLAVVLAGCAGDTLGIRYQAEQQLWKGRQLERRIGSQPEAAGSLIDEAIAEYQAVLDRFPLDSIPEDDEERMLLGQIRGNAALGLVRLLVGLKQDPESAIATLEAIRSDTPKDVAVTARIYAELLRLESQFGTPESVVELLDEVVDRLPPVDPNGDPFPLVLEAPTQKAEILMAVGRETDARAELQVAHVYYDDLIERGKGTTLEVAALLQKANAYVIGERYVEADETMTRARETKEGEMMVPTVLQTQANLRQQKIGDPLGAIRVLEKLQGEFPQDPRAPGAILQAGIAYRAAGMPDSALVLFQRVEALYPRKVSYVSQARFLSGKIYETSGRKDEAIRTYQSVTTDFPRTASGLLAPLELASLYEDEGNDAAAVAVLQRAAEDFQRMIRDLSSLPREAETVLQTMDYLVDVWARLGNWNEAVDTLIALADQFPGDRRSPLAYVRAATIQEEQLGDRAGAIRTLELLRQRYPDLPLSLRAAERIEELKGAS